MADRNGKGTHLLFIWKSSGYELREGDGEVPELGSKVAVDDGEEQVIKIAPSPLPNDSRLCAYLQAL
jgi:hypothetical protein